MKQILLILGLIFTFGVAQAQSAATTGGDQPTQEQRAHTQALKLQKSLMLSDEQTTQVEAVILSRIQEVDKIKADATKSEEQKKSDIADVKDRKDQELATIMTPDQYTKYKAEQTRRNAAKK